MLQQNIYIVNIIDLNLLRNIYSLAKKSNLIIVLLYNTNLSQINNIIIWMDDFTDQEHRRTKITTSYESEQFKQF